MDPLVWLLLLSGGMFVGSLFFAYLPILVKLSEKSLRIITVFGAGLLIGTALIVIVPEGIHMWYSSAMTEKMKAMEVEQGEDGGAHPHAALPANHWEIGASLSIGFAFMLVVERLGQGSHGHSHGAGPRPEATGSRKDAGEAAAESSRSALLGLLVHAGADGVALGASMFSGREALEVLVFIAIMLHKAPAAFGMSTFLLHSGVPMKEVRFQIIMFSSAAPLMAIITYYFLGVGFFQYERKMIAIILLFSAGTFLFVATAHVLPEIQHMRRKVEVNDSDAESMEEGLISFDERRGVRGRTPTVPLTAAESKRGGDKVAFVETEGLSWMDVAFLVIGIIAPLFISVEHKHD